MNLLTQIHLPKASWRVTHQDLILLMGSCFAENIGSKLEENKFNIDINPFGTLYNPASVASALRMLLHPEQFSATDLFEQDGIFHSFAHHSRFSSSSKEECLDKINRRLFASSEFLRKTSRLIITLGSAYIYRLKSDKRIVANCHKLPERLFDRSMLSVSDIIDDWKRLLLMLWEQNPELKILFTVSPIRHWKDGAHGNQLSKATLLLAIDTLQQEFTEQIDYFPAYEIMMDELRDYRFYADDMLHPSALAVDYIWERFYESRFPRETQNLLKTWQEIRKAIEHKPFQPKSESYRQFLLQTLLKIDHINEKMPSFADKEEKELKNRLKQIEYGIQH